MSLSRRRTGASVTVVATEKPQAHTMEIIPAPPESPPETIAVTEVITQPEAQPAAPELVHLGAQKEEALAAFDGRPLSSSVAAREAWFRENPGPEPTFRGLVADLAAWRQASTDPGSAAVPGDSDPAARPAAAGPATGPGPGESGKDADPVPADAPATPGPVSSANGKASTPRPPRKPRTKGAGA